jgi:formate-dependent nitrite reductase membrane component NrfD
VNLEINPYVADADWGILIVLYFFFGGIAAGSYAMAALADLVGDADDHRGVRVAHYLAFPLVCLSGLLLIADLGRPERFWHMILQSNTGWPMFKWWSPMSAGSLGLSVFGLFSFLSFAGVVAEDGWFGLERYGELASGLRTGTTGRLINLGGVLSALFLGSYTGVLLSASNQPIWSNTTWTGALFLASAISTGVAAIVLVDRRLRLGRLAAPALGHWPGVLVPAFVVPVGLLAPLFLKRMRGAQIAELVSLLVLVGGFVLRAAIVGVPVPLLLGYHH